MNRKFAQYLTCLISKDLDFAFNGMGLPSYVCELIENQFVGGKFDNIQEFIENLINQKIIENSITEEGEYNYDK